jgi:hypothetical protein
MCFLGAHAGFVRTDLKAGLLQNALMRKGFNVNKYYKN